VRGILVGSRLQFEQMKRAIEANDIHPVVDEKAFDLSQVRNAYEYMWDTLGSCASKLHKSRGKIDSLGSLAWKAGFGRTESG